MKISRLALAALLTTTAPVAAEPARIVHDEFGRYDRSHPPYDGYQRSTAYIPTRDGTKIAIDLYRPTLNGHLADGHFPVVWTFMPYLRSRILADGTLAPAPETELGLVRFGYNVAVADVRGTGASFGARRMMADANEANDGFDVTEWLAKQPWSDGNIGMTGCSYFGMTALRTATTTPPHLRAMFVGTTIFDQYTGFADGGIVSESLYDQTFPQAYRESVAPVAGAEDLLSQAFLAHRANTDMGTFFKSVPYRDSHSSITNDSWWERSSIYPYIDKMAAAKIAFYIYAGLYDHHTMAGVLTFNNLKNPTKLTYGPWTHCESAGFDLEAEKLRFFDHWLKGKNNGIDREAAAHIYSPGAADGSEWRAMPAWPPRDALRTRYYLSGPEGRVTVGADNERGELSLSAPANPDSADVDFTPRTDIRPLVIYGFTRAGIDQSGLTYTLPAFTKETEMAGIPVLDLWLSANASDVDLSAYIEHVNRFGGATVISTGTLRVSQRAENAPPYDTLGIPWQGHYSKDRAPLQPGRAVEVRLAMKPLSYVFRPGDLLRLVVSPNAALAAPAADDSTSVRIIPDQKPATLTVWRDARHTSFLDMPISDQSRFSMDPH